MNFKVFCFLFLVFYIVPKMTYKLGFDVWEEKNFLKKLVGRFLFWGFGLYSGVKFKRQKSAGNLNVKLSFANKLAGSSIFIANHQQFFDLVWLGLFLRNKVGHKVWFAVHRHNFKALSWRVLSWVLPIVFVDLKDDKLMVKFERILKTGESVFMFPEGTFNIDKKQLLPFYYGPVNLSHSLGVPIYPIGISSDKLFTISPFSESLSDQISHLKHFFRGNITVMLGERINAENHHLFREIKIKTKLLEQKVAELSNLSVPELSDRVVYLREVKVIDKLLQAHLLKMGVDCDLGIKWHWRSLDLLERIWRLSGESDLNIQIKNNSIIGEKVYLFPNQEISAEKLENLIIGDLETFTSYFKS